MSNKYSKALLTLSVILILFPPTLCKFPKLKIIIFKILAWMLIVFTVLIGPLSILVKDSVFNGLPTSSRVVYDLSFAFLYITNIHICLNTIFKQKELSGLLDDCLDKIAQGYDFKVYVACFIFMNTINTTFIILTQIKRTHDKYYYLSVFAVEGFLAFRVITALFIIFLLVNNIKNELVQFNDEIEEWNFEDNLIKKYRNKHNKLCDMAEKVNGLFGSTLLLTMFYFITSFLRHAVFISLNIGISLPSIVRCLWICSYGVSNF